MDILVVAYACEPNRGSEPGVGWSWVNLLAKNSSYIITVITRANNKNVIEKYFESHPTENIEFLYYDLPTIILKYKNGDKNIKLFFTMWQLGVVKFIKKNIDFKKYDFIWDFNFGSLSLPNFIYKLNKSYIIGPISSKKSIPIGYLAEMKSKDKYKYLMQQFMRENIWTNYFSWKTIKKAKKIITCNEFTREFLPRGKKEDSISVFHNGIVRDVLAERMMNYECNDNISFIYAGRLISSKNLEVAIKAFKIVKEFNNNFTFEIIGKGEDEKKLKKLVEKFNLERNIFFKDKISQKELFEKYKKADFFIFPSLLEVSSTSVMEAMYYGLIPICLRIDGMEQILKNDIIEVVSCISPEQDSKEMAKRIINLMSNKEIVSTKKRECHEIAKGNFMWDKKDNELKKILEFIKE